ncbi:hypothetical protein GGF32_006991 [Allomyces javanicus]|nr:hypothetical protein GGF32_006991 [Allomyces javanicus]
MSDADPAAAPAATLVPIQLMEPSTAFIAGTYSATVAALVAFAAAAMMLTRRYLNAGRNAASFSTETFITARGTQAWPRIAWSFYAGYLGAWAIATPANMAATGGYLALISYAVSSGFPVLFVSYAGEKIQLGLPRPLSLSDFVLWRYGRVAQVFVASICILSTALGVISEYSTMGSIFQSFVHATPYPVVAFVGISTMVYTYFGGLLISIVTDQMQGVFSALLFVVLSTYLAATYPRMHLPAFPTETLGATSYGWSTWFTLPASMIASSFFSEATWQRVWAAESKTALRRGAAVAGLMVTVVIGMFGFAGLLAMWAYSPSLDGPAANLLVFYSLGENQYTWIGLVCVVLAATMNQSAVDSAENALTATLTANLFRTKSLKFTRFVVLAVNIPLMVVGTYGLPALNLFLVTNLLTTGAVIPLLSGLVDPQRKWVSGYAMMYATLAAAITLSVYGIVAHGDGNAGVGLEWAWWSNGYDPIAFLVPLVASILGLVQWILMEWAAEKMFGWKVDRYSPEMRAVLTSMEEAERREQENARTAAEPVDAAASANSARDARDAKKEKPSER